MNTVTLDSISVALTVDETGNSKLQGFSGAGLTGSVEYTPGTVVLTWWQEEHSDVTFSSTYSYDPTQLQNEGMPSAISVTTNLSSHGVFSYTAHAGTAENEPYLDNFVNMDEYVPPVQDDLYIATNNLLSLISESISTGSTKNPMKIQTMVGLQAVLRSSLPDGAATEVVASGAGACENKTTGGVQCIECCEDEAAVASGICAAAAFFGIPGAIIAIGCGIAIYFGMKTCKRKCTLRFGPVL